jgi:hypothetical protein
MVDAYGQPTPINQVGTVNVPEPRMVTINVWDKSLVGKVEKAIMESGLGINPQTNGTIIMLPIPELNEERRRELTKVAAQYAENARVAVRNVRHRRHGPDQEATRTACRRTTRNSGNLDPGIDRRPCREGRQGARGETGRDHAGLTPPGAVRRRMRRDQEWREQAHRPQNRPVEPPRSRTDPAMTDPRHVAIIMDGNGRWAQQRGRPAAVSATTPARGGCARSSSACPDLGVEYLTIFAFSTENWKRTQSEVAGLMSLFRRYITSQARD